MKRRRGLFRGDQRGTVMIEFLIALIPMMMMFLGMIQYSFATVAKLVVRHSATLGARAAIVVIEESQDVPGAPEDIYSGLEAGELEVESDSDDPAVTNESGLQNAASSSNSSDDATTQVQGLMEVLDRSSSRVQQIRTAAYMPLLAVSPDLLDDGFGFLAGAIEGDFSSGDTLGSAVGTTGISRLVGAFLYNLGAVAVTFPQSPGSEEFVEEPFAHDGEVTVRVTYMFRCRVPLASLLLCDSGWALFAGTSLIDPGLWWHIDQLKLSPPTDPLELPGFLDRVDKAIEIFERREDRVQRFDEHTDELEQVESPVVHNMLLLRPGARYMVMESEATLPIHGARYYPRSTGD